MVLVPAAEDLVRTLRAEAGRDDRTPAHVTVLFPFLPPSRIDTAVRAGLAEAIGAVPSFRADFRRIGRFPGVVHLEPEPREPFLALTDAVVQRWPDLPPYGGAYDTVIPHLTLVDGPEPPGIAECVADAGTLSVDVTEVALLRPGPDGSWAISDRFGLAPPSSAATG